MLWHGRPCGCGLWLPEDKKKLIFSMDQGENADGLWRLPSQLGNSSDEGLSLEAIESVHRRFVFFLVITILIQPFDQP